MAYNASFETGKLRDNCEAYKEYSSWFGKIEKRIVDLLSPFKSFYYYHPKQIGSASIKSVLPAITGKGYEGMVVADGGTASQEYLRVMFGEGITEEERTAVRKNLEEYCKMDTMAMVRIVDKLNAMKD